MGSTNLREIQGSPFKGALKDCSLFHLVPLFVTNHVAFAALALLLLGLGTGFQRGWLEVRWDRLGQDLETYVNREPQP